MIQSAIFCVSKRQMSAPRKLKLLKPIQDNRIFFTIALRVVLHVIRTLPFLMTNGIMFPTEKTAPSLLKLSKLDFFDLEKAKKKTVRTLRN